MEYIYTFILGWLAIVLIHGFIRVHFSLKDERKKESHFLFKLFVIANSSKYDNALFYHNWDYPVNLKTAFYMAKDIILSRMGIFDGYDIQKIKRECNSCDGTGRWHYWYDNCGEWCFKCNGTGTYKTDTYYLKRFWLNNMLFHSPAYDAPKFGEPIHNTIKGLTKHKDYGKRAGAISAYILCLIYKRDYLFKLTKWIYQDWKRKLPGMVYEKYWNIKHKVIALFVSDYYQPDYDDGLPF
jgi:hypothetical protein